MTFLYGLVILMKKLFKVSIYITFDNEIKNKFYVYSYFLN